MAPIIKREVTNMMRRIVSLLLAVMLLLAVFTGCGGRMSKSENRAMDSGAAEAPAAEQKGDAATRGEMAVAEEPKSAEDATAITGNGSVSDTAVNAILA